MIQKSQSTSKIIRPQAGPQTQFLSSPADIAIYGGAAGGGKTWALLLEPVRHYRNAEFGGVIFRRSYLEVTNEGGLWDESVKLYPLLGARPRLTNLEWQFPKGASLRFGHLQHDGDVYNWQGSQIPFIGFDELTHFSASQFFYMLSRNRSLCGVRPYVRGTCNPDATSWVKTFLAPWIDKKYSHPAKSAEIRWFVREAGEVHWLLPGETHPDAKSCTFIFASIYDNKILLEKDPDYLKNLKALPPVERARLLDGDWDALPSAGKVINRTWFHIATGVPGGTRDAVDASGRVIHQGQHAYDVRFWDFAATEKKTKGDDPDFTAGVLMRVVGNTYYILDVVQVQSNPADVDKLVKNVASQDKARAIQSGTRYMVRWERDPGAAGKIVERHFITLLNGYDARGVQPIGDKVTRAKPFASQAYADNVKLMLGDWNESYLTEMHHFPDFKHDDMVDATTGAYYVLSAHALDIVTTESPYDAVIVDRADKSLLEAWNS